MLSCAIMGCRLRGEGSRLRTRVLRLKLIHHVSASWCEDLDPTQIDLVVISKSMFAWLVF